MDIALPILLLALGMALVVLDVFVPTMGFMTLMALGSFVVSLVLAFGQSTELGMILVGAAIVGVPILIVISLKIFPRTRLGRHMILSEPDIDLHPESLRQDLMGREGVAVSRLRPSGIAELEGERIDVVTRGEMIQTGSRIVVIDNRGNRILVRAFENTEEIAPDQEQEELL